MSEPVLELRGLTKAFGDNIANNAISMKILPGRIHAIVGENGAGKTTMMSMIAGLLQPDSGEILVDGKAREIKDPHDASALGIGMVHQHFKLVPSLSVTDNVFLGREIGTGAGLVDKDAMRSKVRELSENFGLDIDPDTPIRQLSVGLRQRVEVIKALSHDTRILILDEPTAVLTPSESEELFNVMRRLAESGCAVVFISHKLKEVLAVADDLTVIRDGEHVTTQTAEGLTPSDIAKLMVGREVLLRIAHTEGTPGDTALSVDGLSYIDERGALVLDGLSLDVRAGEIVGVAGVEGNGQTELAAAIAGMLPSASGRIVIDGKDVSKLDTKHRRSAGLAYVPEDRHHTGTAPSMSVTDNIVAIHQDEPAVRKGMWISGADARDYAASLIDTFDIRGANPRTPVGSLSGGNMQKVVIAREFSSQPKVLVTAQPTRGVDVGAMEFVHNSLVSARDGGAAVLLISADLNEVMSLSDRLLVLYRGQVVAEFTQSTMSESAVGLAMAGHVPTAEEIAEGRAQADARANDATVARMDAEDVQGTDVFDDAGHVGLEHQTESAGRAIKRVAKAFLNGAVQPVVAVLIALLVGAGVILALGENPLKAYGQLFTYGLSSPSNVGSLLMSFIPLVILAAAVTVSFKAGFFNIGGEGQLLVGAISATAAGVFLPEGLPVPLFIVLIILAGMIGGGLWGLIPGALLAYWRVDIIVTTLMMSSIAAFFTSYLVTAGPLRSPGSGSGRSLPIADGVRLPMFNSSYRFGLDMVITIIAVIFMGLLLTKTVWGLRVRELGEMNHFAEYTGVSPKKMSIQVLTLGGAMAGLAGALFILGPISSGMFDPNFSPGYGFLGITVALLARLNPWAVILAAFFYANMMAGGGGMQLHAGVPISLVSIIQGTIIVLITASIMLTPASRKRMGKMFKNRRGAAPVKGA